MQQFVAGPKVRFKGGKTRESMNDSRLRVIYQSFCSSLNGRASSVAITPSTRPRALTTLGNSPSRCSYFDLFM
jgi:hypothetical protein